MVLDSNGSEVDWHLGYAPSPEEFLEKLEQTLKGVDTFKSLAEGYKKDPKNVEVVFKLAQKYYRRYDREKALQLYQEVLVLDPDGKMGTTDFREEEVTFTEYAEYSIGAIKVAGRKRDPEPLKKFITKYPDSKILKTAYGRLNSYYRLSGKKDEATAFFEEYTSKYPDDPYVLSSYVARIIRDRDNLDKGIELGEKIKDIMKYNPDPSFMKDLAELYMLKGDKGKAEEIFGKKFMEGKVSRMGYDLSQYADFWIKHNTNKESAVEMIELAMKMHPDRWYYFQSAARIYLKLKEEDKALKVYGHEFIEKYQDDSRILNSYAWFWVNQGKNLESALKAAKKSVELAEAAYNLDTLSQVLQKLKRYDEALKVAEKAVELADEEVKIRYKKRVEQIKKAMAKEKEKEK